MSKIYSAYDIALYFLHLARRLDAGDTISNKAMQMYLFVAYHEYLLKYNKILFKDKFEVWEDGFTIKCVYDQYRKYGKLSISFDELVVFNKNLYEDEDVSFLYDMYILLSNTNLYHLKQSILNSKLYKNKFDIKINREITVDDIIEYPVPLNL